MAGKILITPNTGSTTVDPTIAFQGAGIATDITLRVPSIGGLSFEGTTGQLFSISDSMSGTIFSVNDVSGIPSIEVLDTGLVKLAQYSGNVLLGTATDNGTNKLQVNGSILATSFTGAGTGLTGTAASLSIGGNAATATTADQIDGIAFRNTGSNSAVNADSLNSNGITYYTAGVTNFSGNATDGALYSQIWDSTYQHQIAGDYRSGQIALRGKNAGTWQAWRTVLDSSNYNTYSPTLTGTGASGSWAISITGNAANVTGVVAIANGGTNSSATATLGGIGYGTGTAHAYTAAGTAGQVLTSNGGAAPIWQSPSSSPITVLDDVSGLTDSRNSVYTMRINAIPVLNTYITDSKDLQVMVNGRRLEPYIKNGDVMFMPVYDVCKGFRVRGNKVIIYNPPERGSQITLIAQPISTTKQIRRYPFSATNIGLGA